MSDDRLYKLHADAVRDFESGPKFNWTLRFECDSQDLDKLVMHDVQEVAAKWRSVSLPVEFYFTHAQYYTDGVRHIINELTAKPSSNRALYSLISQKDIRSSGDLPIPSFMTLQCQIEKEVLYCTCYFRAIEVSTFLKINLEEIRQTLVEIFEGVPRFSRVCLTVIAFRAYIDTTRSPLRRPRLEILHDDELQALLVDGAPNPVRELDDMLRELREGVTAVSAQKLISLQRILSRRGPGLAIHPSLAPKLGLFSNQLLIAIERTKALEQLRRKESHGEAVGMATRSYQDSIDALRATLGA